MANYWYFSIWHIAAAQILCEFVSLEGRKKGRRENWRENEWICSSKTTQNDSIHHNSAKDTGLGEGEAELDAVATEISVLLWGGLEWWSFREFLIESKWLHFYTTASFIRCRLPLGKGHDAGLSGFLWPRQFLQRDSCKLSAINTPRSQGNK